MATAYLLASVLTLIVVLVHGQEAFPEQGNIVVVAEDSFEDELNSFTDLILPGSANTRAECIQKKKCKNKGGTCQNKGNTCPGKFVKGCSKGCSCCLPEEISCKPSKRCKRANGACIARGECNGKIISTGCKKPRSCKKTHVCCVQDETTTEVPTCRGPSCPLPGSCPGNFPDNYVCKHCDNIGAADVWINRAGFTPLDNPSLVFAGMYFDGKTSIDYNPIGTSTTKCEIKDRVQVWSCKPSSTGPWRCTDKGFGTAIIELDGANYKPNNQPCTCLNPIFEKKHLCKICKDDTAAKTKCEKNRKATKGLKNTVLDADNQVINYHNQEGICSIDSPTSFLAWECDTIKKEGKWVWNECNPLGSCSNIQSNVHDGHLYFDRMICYHVHFGKIWNNECQTTKTIIIDPDTAANCMKKCTKETANECNAFNYKIGESCILKKCPTEPFPKPIHSPEGYDAYYL